jgi:periplasmic divalent cation tolerance protein
MAINRQFIQIYLTIDNREKAEEIANSLVENRLAACVQISGPIQSIYHWAGKIEKSTEWKCSIKTTKDLYQEVRNLIKSKHSYEIPEIFSQEIAEVDHDYEKWLRKALK